MKFFHVSKGAKSFLVQLQDFPQKPKVFVDRLSWFVGGVVVGFIIAYLITK